MARKGGVGLNAPRVIGGRMTGSDLFQVYALMRRIARGGIGQRKAFRWQKCKSLTDTLRDYREEFRCRPSRGKSVRV
jgi:hypothetical protein